MEYHTRHSGSTTSIRKDQKGLVAIFVVMIIMILLSLIVLAFGRIVRREQRQSLDRQLNAQALFAAESGVNDAIHALSLPANSGLLAQDHTECTGASSFTERAGLASEVGPGSNASYSCLMVDPTPNTLVFNNIHQGESRVTPIRTDTGVSSINVKWRNQQRSQHSGCPSLTDINGNSFHSSPDANCGYAVMRLELVAFGASNTRDSLTHNGRAIFFAQPSSSIGGGSATWASGAGNNQGRRVAAACRSIETIDSSCDISITNLTNFVGYLRLTPIYHQADVEITARDASGAVGLAGSQAMIDVTGKASDVLRRIRVHHALNNSINSGIPLPGFALESTNTQCKRFTISDTEFTPDPADGCGL